MSDDDSRETSTPDEEVARPKPSPRPEPASTDSGEPAASPAPLSVTGRARRIGGRPVPADQPAAPAADATKKRPAPPPPGTGRHQVAPPPQPAKVKPEKVTLAKAEAAPKLRRAPSETPADRVAWIPAGVLAVAVVALLVLIGIASHGVYWDKTTVSSSQRNSTQEAALAAAKACVASINTYDYRKLPTAEAAAVACATGKLINDLKTVYTQKLNSEAPVAKATQTAQINQAGIRDVSTDGKQVDVLIFGQLTVTNVSTASTSPQYQPFGVVATMDDVNGKWLVAKLSADVGGSVGS